VAGGTPDVAAWHRNPRALHRATPSAILVAAPTADEVMRVEGAAAYVWNALAERSTFDEIVAAVAAVTDRSTDEIRVAISTALPKLELAGLIVRSDG
jgi:hypothetical protein